MAVALSLAATSLRLKSFTAVRFFSFYRKTPKTHLTPTFHFPLKSSTSNSTPFLPLHYSRTRSFCSVISAAVSSGEATKTETFEKNELQKGERVGEFRKRLRIVDVKGGPDEGLNRLDETLVVRGWVRTFRAQSGITFIEVNDGSCLSNLQCVMTSDAEGYDQIESGLISTGASLLVQGVLVKSQGSKQKVELKVEKLILVGTSDPSFPIQKKRVSREFLRTKAHLRPRTNTFGAVARVRNALAYATHKFFQENGFVWVSSPIITASDCEGAGEQFCVTTLIPSSRETTDSPVAAIPRTEDGSVDWSQDFFGKPAFLTVSGQLNGETYATALSDDVVEKSFVLLTYTDAIDLLLKAKKKFEFPVKWGCDLQSEHERYITEVAFGGCPVIIRDYPKEIKAFYMRENDDEKTVAAMDMLVPQVGELIGGSQREERLEYLEKRLDGLKLNKESYWWYLDLRRYGSVPHAGFGLGFERLVQFATGIDNIRDAIPFPRTPGSAEF
ncbi:asparagine--tRNA ligase, chloroplastic/mitochondrial-like isoform X3 [Coffea arabica]|uniref:Asparagine--tRNA ligase, chloroplastic/mitochondrial-like isoform X3 n=1 Tax=Coffea arabica TaxID=13443 RepID=A0ABM4VJT9_COFAR